VMGRAGCGRKQKSIWRPERSGVAPFAGLRGTGGARWRRSARVRTSRGVELAMEHCLPTGPRFIWASPWRRRARLVSSAAPRLSGRPSPAPFEAGSFSCACSLLRSLFACLPGHFFRGDAVLPGVLVALFAALTMGVHLRGKSRSPLRSALGFSQPLGGLLHPLLCGLVSSRSHVQGSSVQGFLPLRSSSGSSPAPASMPFAECALTGCPAATRPRLDFEALLHGAMRSIEARG